MSKPWKVRGKGRWWGGLVAGLMLALVAGLTTPPSALANGSGDSFYTRESSDEFLAYSRIIRLEHSGSANGTLIGTFEHANRGGGPSEYVIRTSKDDGATWQTLTTVSDPLEGGDHPSDQLWQPFLFELPKKMGKYPAGTLLLAGNMAPSSDSGTDFVLWRSTDHGENWDFQSRLQTGGGKDGAPHGGSGIWEPFLTVDGAGRLAMYFADERTQPEQAQVIAHIVSNDGGDTWSANPDGSKNFEPGLVVDVGSTSETDRPGMPTVATMPDGRMVLAYEICGEGRNCEAYTKTSTDGGTTWGEGPTDLGDKAVTSDGRYLGSSPYVAWSPAGGPDGQLILSGMRTRYTDGDEFTPEDRQALFVKDPNSAGDWSWMPAPFKPVSEPEAECSASYSPHLLLDDTGESVRFTTATAAGPTGCMAATGVTNSGVLPYQSDFTKDTSGWIDYGGCWEASDGVLSETCGGDGGNKSLAGSTKWTDYRLEGDVRLGRGGQGGFLVRASDPSTGADAHDGYYVGVTSTNIVLGKQDGGWQQLEEASIPGGLKDGEWYRLSVEVVGCDVKVTGHPSGSDAESVAFEYTDSDCSFPSGAIGVRDHAGTADWRDITVTEAG